MATLLWKNLLVIAVFAPHLAVSQILPRSMERVSLCVRGAKAQERGCFFRGCPNGWRSHKINNYLMCWARPSFVCCEKEVPPPPPVDPPFSPASYPECGFPSVTARIARGEDETKCQSPWQASLRRINDPLGPTSINNSYHVAGGVLVQTRWVLTTPLSLLLAGRNTPDEVFQDQMLVALRDFNHRTRTGDELLYRVRQVYFHPDFRFRDATDFVSVIEDSFTSGTDRVWQENAFALIELDGEVPISDCVRPVCLPNGNLKRCSSAPCKLTGWGADENENLKDILQKAEMTLLDSEACLVYESDLNRTNSESQYPARTGCAVNDERSFACVGDFGGPVVCQGSTVNEPRTLEGLSVTRLECDDSNIPTRVALVREAMEWIEETILRNS